MVARPCEFESHPAHKREETMKIVASLFFMYMALLKIDCIRYEKNDFYCSIVVQHDAFCD